MLRVCGGIGKFPGVRRSCSHQYHFNLRVQITKNTPIIIIVLIYVPKCPGILLSSLLDHHRSITVKASHSGEFFLDSSSLGAVLPGSQRRSTFNLRAWNRHIMFAAFRTGASLPAAPRGRHIDYRLHQPVLEAPVLHSTGHSISSPCDATRISDDPW